MKISKQIWVDQSIKWNALVERKIIKKNQYKGHAYVVCTSPHPNLLFEIFEARMLSDRYDSSTLIALCHNKKKAVEMVTVLIDAIYNQKTKTYDDFLE